MSSLVIPSSFLHTQFHWQAVGIPTRFAFHAVAFQGVKPAENIFDRPRHHVVDPRFAIGGWRAFKKHVGTVFRSRINAALERVFIAFPTLQDFTCDIGQVQRTPLRENKFVRGESLMLSGRIRCAYGAAAKIAPTQGGCEH